MQRRESLRQNMIRITQWIEAKLATAAFAKLHGRHEDVSEEELEREDD